MKKRLCYHEFTLHAYFAIGRYEKPIHCGAWVLKQMNYYATAKLLQTKARAEINGKYVSHFN